MRLRNALQLAFMFDIRFQKSKVFKRKNLCFNVCLLHDVVLTEYQLISIVFKCFSNPDEEELEDAASKDVVQEVDIGNET